MESPNNTFNGENGNVTKSGCDKEMCVLAEGLLTNAYVDFSELTTILLGALHHAQDTNDYSGLPDAINEAVDVIVGGAWVF